MATATISPAVVRFPQSTPAQQPITQLELEMFLSLRNRLSRLQEQLDAEEETLKARVAAGAPIEPGIHVVGLKESSRRNVAWKAVVVRLAERLRMDGEAYCARVLAATKPNKSITVEVN